MRWTYGRQSSNIEDRRGMGGGFGGTGLKVGAGGGLGIIVIAVIAMFLGVDPSVILQGGLGDGGGSSPGYEQPRGSTSPQEAEREKFVSYVLGDTEETWKTIFQQSGKQYEEPTLVLFSGAVDSACGSAQAATGPFYCPGDRKLYVDLSFFDELEQRFGAPGDFAQAYVVAHEVGHHVQTLLGVTQQVQSARQQIGRDQANQLSVLTELQADCYAGVWANHAQEARQVLEPGDIDEGLRAAAAVGDDRIQRETQGRVVPDSFTHGSSEQRMTWFRRGLERGDVNQCDTFQAAGM
jgi:predicted metalloprotease